MSNGKLVHGDNREPTYVELPAADDELRELRREQQELFERVTKLYDRAVLRVAKTLDAKFRSPVHEQSDYARFIQEAAAHAVYNTMPSAWVVLASTSPNYMIGQLRIRELEYEFIQKLAARVLAQDIESALANKFHTPGVR